MYFSYITRLFFGSKPQQVFPDVSKYDIYPKWVQKKDEKKRKKEKREKGRGSTGLSTNTIIIMIQKSSGSEHGLRRC